MIKIMFTNFDFKIHFVFTIAFAFIFRLLFVNVGLVNSLSSSNNHKLVKSHFSSIIKKRRKQAEPVVVKSSSDKYSAIDMCEEVLDIEDELDRSNTPAVLAIFYSLYSGFISSIKQVIPFDYIKCELQPKRYLSLSVLRL